MTWPAPASQILTQADLLEKQGKPVQARDVLAVARRMLRALERYGLAFAGQTGEQVFFDPNQHTPINEAAQPQAGQPVTIRFAGVTYQGKMIYKAIGGVRGFMPGRLAVDFGTSNTVVALWDETHQQGVPLHIPEFGMLEKQGDETISLIPSLIHYAPDNRTWIGSQVIQRGLRQSPRTFRWMKRYISHRSPNKMRIDGREITPYIAGQDFLSSVLVFAAQETGFRDEEVALSVPVEAFEHYENWLASVAESAGMPRFRLIDEPSAAALGYGAHIQPGNVYLLFDFGGGTLHAAVVLIEAEESGQAGQRLASGRRCRVLGKAGRDIGGTTIDQWIFQEVLRQNHRSDGDEDVRRISTALLVECERVKEKLSFAEQADLSVVNPETGAVMAADFTRAGFEELLDQHDLFTEINQTIRSAINAATERGYDESSIQAVLMVGGSSQIPAVQRTLRQIFGRERVKFNRPLDAVARGAAAFVAGVDFFDHIQHDYAIRYVNPEKGKYDYRTIVQRGTPYPTQRTCHTPVH